MTRPYKFWNFSFSYFCTQLGQFSAVKWFFFFLSVHCLHSINFKKKTFGRRLKYGKIVLISVPLFQTDFFCLVFKNLDQIWFQGKYCQRHFLMLYEWIFLAFIKFYVCIKKLIIYFWFSDVQRVLLTSLKFSVSKLKS